MTVLMGIGQLTDDTATEAAPYRGFAFTARVKQADGGAFHRLVPGASPGQPATVQQAISRAPLDPEALLRMVYAAGHVRQVDDAGPADLHATLIWARPHQVVMPRPGGGQLAVETRPPSPQTRLNWLLLPHASRHVAQTASSILALGDDVTAEPDAGLAVMMTYLTRSRQMPSRGPGFEVLAHAHHAIESASRSGDPVFVMSERIDGVTYVQRAIGPQELLNEEFALLAETYRLPSYSELPTSQQREKQRATKGAHNKAAGVQTFTPPPRKRRRTRRIAPGMPLAFLDLFSCTLGAVIVLMIMLSRIMESRFEDDRVMIFSTRTKATVAVSQDDLGKERVSIFGSTAAYFYHFYQLQLVSPDGRVYLLAPPDGQQGAWTYALPRPSLGQWELYFIRLSGFNPDSLNTLPASKEARTVIRWAEQCVAIDERTDADSLAEEASEKIRNILPSQDGAAEESGSTPGGDTESPYITESMLVSAAMVHRLADLDEPPKSRECVELLRETCDLIERADRKKSPGGLVFDGVVAHRIAALVSAIYLVEKHYESGSEDIRARAYETLLTVLSAYHIDITANLRSPDSSRNANELILAAALFRCPEWTDSVRRALELVSGQEFIIDGRHYQWKAADQPASPVSPMPSPWFTWPRPLEANEIARSLTNPGRVSLAEVPPEEPPLWTGQDPSRLAQLLKVLVESLPPEPTPDATGPEPTEEWKMALAMVALFFECPTLAEQAGIERTDEIDEMLEKAGGLEVIEDYALELVPEAYTMSLADAIGGEPMTLTFYDLLVQWGSDIEAPEQPPKFVVTQSPADPIYTFDLLPDEIEGGHIAGAP